MKNFWKLLLYVVQFAVGLFVLNLVIKLVFPMLGISVPSLF